MQQRYAVFCDETATNSGRYMVIGGIWCPMGYERLVRANIDKFRDVNNLNGELKWTKVSDRYLNVYQDFVSIFFDIPVLQFNCIVVDKHILDYRAYHENDKELAFYKFYYQLLSRKIDPENLYWIYTDQKSNRKGSRLSDLMNTVNGWCWREHQRRPVKHIEARSSKADSFIQMADILIGAVQCDYNGTTNRDAKLQLANFIASKCNFRNLRINTSRNKRPVNIWQWKPGGSW